MANPQRQPIPYARDNTRTIEIVQEPARQEQVINIVDDAKQLQAISKVPPTRLFRRLFFIWFRVYVRETKHNKTERVNIRIPLPIPIIGAAFSRQLSMQKAAKIAAELRRGRAVELDELLESEMGYEFVRVHEEHPERGKSELVVIGFD
ncbi:MAG: hypothetical protein HDKAJFGB_01532 [Anaerolineae bacterium]|nr:hypothetical protein [Anaerolineae bacterium]RIK26091.1 MAG: hypothetical protein DCC52_10550 [Chloroflexota bacterium]